MKILLTSDIHQHIPKWKQLVVAVQLEQPRFVLIAGDLLPKSSGYKGQHDFFPKLAQYLLAMRKAGAQVLLMMGNDDFHTLEPKLNLLVSERLCINMNGQVHREEGITFCGIAHVRDYPFGYKNWCVPDGDFIQCPVQFCGEGLTVDEQGQWVQLPSLWEHLSEKPSLETRLETIIAQLKPGELGKSIWLVHQPPSEMGMDICADGQQVGSPTVRKLIQNHQPLFGISGHIHESPYQKGGRWVGLIKDSLWFQPGQMENRLHYVSLEVTAVGNICNIRHSVFGRTPIEFERFRDSGG